MTNTQTIQPNEDTKRNTRLTKIRFLIEKAESTDFEAERDAYTAKAQALLAKYAIDASELRSNHVEADEVVTKRLWVHAPYSKPRVGLLHAICRANDVHLVTNNEAPSSLYRRQVQDVLLLDDKTTGKGRCVWITGWSRDLEAVVLLYSSLLIQAQREFALNEVPSWENKRSFQTAFLIGFSNGVGSRLRKARKDAIDEAVVESGEDLLPVLRNRKVKVEDAVEQKWKGSLRQGRSSSSRSYSGYGAGHSAGQRADVGSARISTSGGRALNA